METTYLGDGVYASFNGCSVLLDLRGQDDTTKIYLEYEVLKALEVYAKECWKGATRTMTGEKVICDACGWQGTVEETTECGACPNCDGFVSMEADTVSNETHQLWIIGTVADVSTPDSGRILQDLIGEFDSTEELMDAYKAIRGGRNEIQRQR